jgi:translation initiation factor IF-1
MQGKVVDKHPGSLFTVQLDSAAQHTILATIAGRLRKNHIRILTGDRVQVEISPYDLTRGRITYRFR